MPQLQNFKGAKQDNPNSCWASASRAINNYFQYFGKSGNNPIYLSDQDLATAWSTKGRTDPVRANISIQQSASAALKDLGYKNNIDDKPLPSPDEITQAMAGCQPLLAIVGDVDPKGKPDGKYQGGHWVVIVGISVDKSTISVFDPDDGQTHQVPYNASTYQTDLYWQNTSYVDGR